MLSFLKLRNYDTNQLPFLSPNFLLKNCTVAMKFPITCTFPSTKTEMPLVWKDSISHIWYVIYRWVPALLSLYVPNCCQAVHILRFTHCVNRLCSLTNCMRGGYVEKIKETKSNIKVFQLIYACCFSRR